MRQVRNSDWSYPHICLDADVGDHLPDTVTIHHNHREITYNRDISPNNTTDYALISGMLYGWASRLDNPQDVNDIESVIEDMKKLSAKLAKKAGVDPLG